MLEQLLNGEYQICYKVVQTTLIKSCCNKIVTNLTTQGCNNMVIRTVSVLLEQLCNVSDCMLQVINRLALNMFQQLKQADLLQLYIIA